MSRKDDKKKNKTKTDEETEIDEIRNEQDEELNKYNCNKQIIHDNSFKLVAVCYNFAINSCVIFFKVSSVYLLWILLHYSASHLYVQLCVPKTVVGFLMSPFMTLAPHCQGLRWLVYNAASFINNMWVILGTWMCSNILMMNNSE